MVAVPLSAFEVYQQTKQAKKKSRKKKKSHKNDLKVNSLVKAELMKVADERKSVPFEGNSKPEIIELQSNSRAVASHIDPEISPVVSNANANSSGSSSSSKKHKKKKKAKKVEDEPETLEVEEGSGVVHSMATFETLSGLESSVEIAEKFFAWMLEPIGKEDFLSLYWEKKPVHVSRENSRSYYSNILSTSAIDAMLRKHNIMFGKNIDITYYSDGKRETLNPAGRAHASIVWDFYRNGCSVRLLNPQTYHPELRELNTRLQEVFGSFVGANAYLTPPNSQGFAPHFDDIEAFVLQIEGRKMWRVYAPRNVDEKLPRTSSPNFSQEEIGEPILEVLVKAGDLLYFPRGFIHQASTVPGHHSLHVTVSTYQKNSWADLLEKLVPAALANAIEEDEEFRKGIPLDIMNHIGAVHSESDSPQRSAIFMKLKKLFSKLFAHAPVDAAADQLAKEYIHESLPPCLSSAEKKCSVFESGERMGNNGKLQGGGQLSLETRIRLTRSNVLRLVSEEDSETMIVYHSMANSLEYRGEDLQSVEIPLSFALAVEHLILAYPNFTPICELPLDEDEAKVQIASELWDRGLVLSESPLSVDSS